MYRRDVLALLGATVAGQWNGEGQFPDALDDYDPVDRGIYPTGETTARDVTGHFSSPHAETAFDGGLFDEHTASVWYDYEGVKISAEAKGTTDDDSTLRTGWLMDFSPEEARELAIALFQAAEERERRGAVDDGGEQ